MTPSPASSPRAGLPGLEMVPLAERLRAMHFLRLALAALVIVAYVALPGVAHGNLPILAAGTAGYLVLSITGYFLWRAGRGRGLILFSALLLLDGAFLAWATYASGGVGSPPAYLLFAYVVAVTLVASYRTGLKVVLWESLLLLAAFQVRATGILPALGIHPPAPGSAEYRRVILLVVGLWLTGIVTASYSALNERELRRRRFDLTSLADMADELEQDMRPAAIAGMLLRRTSETFDFTRGLVLARSDYGRLAVLAAEGTEPTLGTVPATDTVERAWATHAPLLVKRLLEREDAPLAELLPDGRNLLVVPLIAEGRPIGVLLAEHSKPRIDGRAVTMLAQFASHASLALRNAWLLEEMREMADRDALTGIANRRSFDARLALELKRAQRTNDPLSLLLVDLDHFKRLNDAHGHLSGDEALRRVAASLGEHAREIDMPARYGGEEFALVLPSCSPEDAAAVADRVREGISELQGLPATLTASVGVASWPRNALDARALLAASDAALYAAKRSGRDRVVSSDTVIDELADMPSERPRPASDGTHPDQVTG